MLRPQALEALSLKQQETKQIFEHGCVHDRSHLVELAFSHEEFVLLRDSQPAVIIKNKCGNHGKSY